jgi:hypothetical protein
VARPCARPPSVAVRETADGAHRPSWRHPRPSVMRPWTLQYDGPQRDKVTHTGTEQKRPASANSQLAGRFPRVWQVLGSSQRRLSRRFYRPTALAAANIAHPRDSRGGQHRFSTTSEEHAPEDADTRRHRPGTRCSGLLIRGFGVQVPDGAPALTWGFSPGAFFLYCPFCRAAGSVRARVPGSSVRAAARRLLRLPPVPRWAALSYMCRT